MHNIYVEYAPRFLTPWLRCCFIKCFMKTHAMYYYSMLCKRFIQRVINEFDLVSRNFGSDNV